uniref:Translation machinery-associated protein 16 n=1 Tax=Cacopsylla melanoneura TaxID=428564 RepID=A0A8D8LJN5_9HEMI
MGKKKSVSVNKISHPNSRKVKQLSKQCLKVASRDKSKMQTYMKQNLHGEKLLWFQQHIDADSKEMTPEYLDELFTTYLARFDDELDQIQLKHSVGQRSQAKRQHASREDVIVSTKKRELEEYLGCGIELVDVFIPKQLELLKSWTGELRYLPNFVLKRFNKSSLEKKFTSKVKGSSKNKDSNSKVEDNAKMEIS